MKHFVSLSLLLLFCNLISFILVTLSNLSLHGFLLGVEFLSLLFHRFCSNSQFRSSDLALLHFVLINLRLNLLLLFKLQLAQSLLIVLNHRFALFDCLKHFLFLFALFGSLKGFTLGDGLLDHFLLALGFFHNGLLSVLLLRLGGCDSHS